MCGCNLRWSSNVFDIWYLGIYIVKMSSNDCHISWVRWRLGAVKQWTISWSYVYQDLRCNMASLRCLGLITFLDQCLMEIHLWYTRVFCWHHYFLLFFKDKKMTWTHFLNWLHMVLANYYTCNNFSQEVQTFTTIDRNEPGSLRPILPSEKKLFFKLLKNEIYKIYQHR